MKIRISKKTYLLLFLFLFFFITFIGGLYLISNGHGLGQVSYRLDKYSGISQYAVKAQGFFKRQISYQGFVKGMSEKDGIICFELGVLTDSNELESIQICEKEANLMFEKEKFFVDKTIPANATFDYTISLFSGHKLKKINLGIMDDREVATILSLLNTAGISLENVRIEETEEILRKGYYYDNVKEINGGKAFDSVLFRDAVLKEIKVDRSRMSLSFFLRVEDKIINIVAESEKFNLDGFGLINSKNYKRLSLGKDYQVLFSFVPLDTEVTVEKVLEYCEKQGGEALDKAYCRLPKGADIDDYKIDIEDYLNERVSLAEDGRVSIDKLMLDMLIPND